MDKYVRLNSWVSPAQKAFLEKRAKEGTGKGKVTQAELVRHAIYKVYKVK